MKTTQQLHDLGQSLWLDNITRGLLTSGVLHDHIRDLSVAGLTSNPTIFDRAIRDADFYDTAIRQKAAAGHSGETLFYELALEDLAQAADLFRPSHDATHGVDGWVSLEISPLLASARWKKLERAGARAQRLLWASTGTKDPKASDTLYVEALAAPNTINTLPEKTLQAFAEHGRVKEVMPPDGGDAEELLAAFANEGVNDAELATEIQHEGARAFSNSWQDMLECLAAKSEMPKSEKQA